MANEVRITVKVTDRSKDIDKAKDRVDDLGAAAQKTGGKLRDAEHGIGTLGESAKKTGHDVDGLGKDTERVGSRIGQAAVEMVSNFGNVGASIAGAGGPVAAIALLGVAVAALPAIATAAGAGIALGLGAAIGGIGIAAAAQSERVKNAFTNVKNHVVSSLEEMAKPFEPVLMGIAAKTISAFDRLSPAIGEAFAQIAPLVDKFAASLLGAVGNLGPTISRITANFKPLMNVLSARLPDVIEHVTSSLVAMSGAADPHAFSALISVINGTIDALSFLVVSLETVASVATSTADALAAISPQWGSPESNRQADDLYKRMVGTRSAADGMSGSVQGASNSVKDLGNNAQVAADKLKAWHAAVLQSYNSELSFRVAVDEASKGIERQKGHVRGWNDLSIRNAQLLLGIANASQRMTDDVRKSGGDVNAAMTRGYRAFIKAARGAHLTKAEAEALARQIHLVPGGKNIKFKTNANAAAARVAHLRAMLNGIPSAIATTIAVNLAYSGLSQNTGAGNRARHGRAHGGVIGAQGGGPRSRMTLVGEQGPELVDLAPGSTVHSNPDTRRMLGQGGGQPIIIQLMLDGQQIAEATFDPLKGIVRKRGGKGPNSAQNAWGFAG